MNYIDKQHREREATEQAKALAFCADHPDSRVDVYNALFDSMDHVPCESLTRMHRQLYGTPSSLD